MSQVIVGQRVSAVDEYGYRRTGETLFIDPNDGLVLVKLDDPLFEGHGGHGFTPKEIQEKAEGRAWWFPPDFIKPLN